MNIYLTGMMGSGKSVTGKALAALTGYQFTDIDSEIEKQEGRPIVEIFATDGESYFRDVETAVLKKISAEARRVFATGGGIILRDENVDLMKRTGKIILLEATLPVLWERVCRNRDRPLLNTPDPMDALEGIYEVRKARYRATCDHAVMTDGLTAEATAQQIKALMK
ncbi:MAG TPA: shikimate kinase [Candidatus Omnitrophota bacterium]|jgi:shikimate kinase|nr:MAG: Shikimate kinase [Candidatus Omnitrophica bacterium ADurb.Bin314]HOE68219.1 shikimate kinase [Candidatus Omnitrophota bacterium]HQB94689.1 shikimate kinase [Candidatus Omnitrophota bacterium]